MTTRRLLPVLLLTSSLSIHPAIGRPHPPPPMSSGGGLTQPEPEPQRQVREAELGTALDKFEAFRQLQFQGDAFYLKEEADLQAKHAGVYRKITRLTISERIAVDVARKLVNELIQIGRDAVTARNAGGDDDPEASATAALLDALATTVEKAVSRQVEADLLTPELNRRQWLMDELVRHADEGALSEGRTRSLLRRLEGLLDAEKRAKKGSSLNDNSREKLIEKSSEVWESFVEAFDD